MSGIAADEDAPITKLIRDQTAAHPVFFRNDFVVKIGPDTEYLADRPIAINRIISRLAVVEEVVNIPIVLAIDGDRGAATARIECEVHPGGFASEEIHERRRMDIR